MKITIITVCLNSEKTIPYTLNSVLTQTYKNIEHIIVDGGSTDNTKKILNKYPNIKKKIFYTKKIGIYEAINIGIKKSTGDVISILNSDDILNSINTISNAVQIIKKNKIYNIFLGNVVFFKDNFHKITRHYSVNNFQINQFKFGMMPPHPGSFFRREVYAKYGLYKKNFKIAADFEIFLRLLLIKKIKYKKINLLVTRMKTGGISGKNIYAYVISTVEILKSFRMNNLKNNFFNIISRIPLKISQFLIFNVKMLNKDFQYVYSNFLRKTIKPDFKIIKNIQNLNFKKNFFLSAMNLAFLGGYIKGEIKKNDSMINWPDGYFSKTLDINLKKTPGRDIVKKIKINKLIKKIIVFGYISNNSLLYLKKIYKLPLENRILGYGNINDIIKNVNCKLKKNELIFITLPTPKQEIFAAHLISKNKNYKIICIGGSIAIASGDEREVPRNFLYFEFLWRLRYETFRRLKRLIITFIYYSYGNLFTKKLKELKIEYI
jgi:glycosyltransferase involved in cell wall biosynthesis